MLGLDNIKNEKLEQIIKKEIPQSSIIKVKHERFKINYKYKNVHSPKAGHRHQQEPFP